MHLPEIMALQALNALKEYIERSKAKEKYQLIIFNDEDRDAIRNVFYYANLQIFELFHCAIINNSVDKDLSEMIGRNILKKQFDVKTFKENFTKYNISSSK